MTWFVLLWIWGGIVHFGESEKKSLYGWEYFSCLLFCILIWPIIPLGRYLFEE